MLHERCAGETAHNGLRTGGMLGTYHARANTSFHQLRLKRLLQLCSNFVERVVPPSANNDWSGLGVGWVVRDGAGRAPLSR